MSDEEYIDYDEEYVDHDYSDGYADNMDEENDIDLKMTKSRSKKQHGNDEDHEKQLALDKLSSTKWESKRFKNAEGQTFILQSEVFDQLMIKIKQEVVELVCLDIDDCILIFHEFGWSMQKLQNKYFSDQEKVFAKLGFDKEEKYYEECKKKQQLKETFRDGTNELCNLCFCESETVASCKQGHTFCTDCWRQYVLQKLKEKNPFFTCMEEGCNSFTRHSFIIQILSGPQDVASKEVYKKFIGMSYVEENKNIQYCPGNDCHYAGEKMDGIAINSMKCLCGTNFCFRCQQINHYPCNCKQYRDFNEMLNRDDANLLWIINNAKMCPYCNRAVERSMGCNYIRCSQPCNKSFCYVCEQPWLDDADGSHHRSAHMNCNTYQANKGDKKDDKLTEKEKQQKMLEKVSFYVGKFKDCMRSIEVIQKKKGELVQPTREILSNKLNISFNDSQFLEDAFDILIDTRQTLQWSYAFAYFFKPEQTKSKALFEDLQMIFAGFCEQLAILLSNSFVDYTKLIKNTDFSKNFSPDLLQKYQDFKQQISKLSNAIRTNSHSLLESVYSGSVFID